MTVVSTKEFNTNQDKYFRLALNEQVFIQRGSNMFVVSTAEEPQKRYKEPDDDLCRAITMDELLIGVQEDIREMFKRGR